LQNAGWLELPETGIKFPNFDRHNSRPAKTRALGARRSKTSRKRNANSNAESVTEPLPEKRREEKRVSTNVDTTPIVPYDEIVTAWNQTEGVTQIRKLTDSRKRTLKSRLADKDWDWRAALAKFPLGFNGSPDRPWTPDFDWFIRPDSVNRILEGKYDQNGKGQPHTPTVEEIARNLGPMS
jgi:hypothetical protein